MLGARSERRALCKIMFQHVDALSAKEDSMEGDLAVGNPIKG